MLTRCFGHAGRSLCVNGRCGPMIAGARQPQYGSNDQRRELLGAQQIGINRFDTFT